MPRQVQKKEARDNPFVTIAVSIAAISVGLTAVVLLFASEHASLLPFMVGSLSVMGICMGYFISLERHS